MVLLLSLQTYRVQSRIVYGDYVQAPPWLIWQLTGFQQQYPNFTPKQSSDKSQKEGKLLVTHNSFL